MGTGTDILRDFVGTVEECERKCDELQCIGFIRVHSGAPQHEGRCYFRGGEMQRPYDYTADDRDCYLPGVYGNARIVLHCDNELFAYEKSFTDDWKLVHNFRSWTQQWDWTFPVRPSTELKLQCVDHGSVGAFIATVTYNYKQYSTTNPMSNSFFRITEGDTTNLKYNTKESSPWHRTTAGIADDAYWVWNGKVFNTMVFEFNMADIIDGDVPEQCYTLEGNPSIIWGDPHTTTFAGVKHDFQGVPQNGLDQFYYIHPCAGYNHNDLPYHVLGRHVPYRGSTRVSGLDYLAIELFDDNNHRYVAFFNSAIHGYAMGESTVWEDVENSATMFIDGTTTMIGSRFKVHFVQNHDTQITVTLTVDDECDLHFTMIGQYDYSADLQRYTMHYVRMNTPECYKCAVCGLYGDFKGYQMQTCDGNTVSYGGYTNAWDERGWTWEKTYTNEFCEVTDDPEATPSPTNEPYVPPPDPTFPYDPCDDESSTLKQRANQECEEAREAQRDCCDRIGAVFCDDLMENCAWDSCFASEGDEDAIFNLVAAIVTYPIEDECDELVVDERITKNIRQCHQQRVRHHHQHWILQSRQQLNLQPAIQPLPHQRHQVQRLLAQPQVIQQRASQRHLQ